MALIKCNECGRTISDQASACVGCGAPLPRPAGLINLEPERSPAALPSQRRLGLLLLAGALLLGCGIWLGERLEHRSRAMATVAALIIIIGLCTLIVAALQLEAARRRRREPSRR
jgi:hypothetical protein